MNIDTPDKQAEYANLKVDFAFTVSIILLGEYCARHDLPPSKIVEIWKDHCSRARAMIKETLPPDVEPAVNETEFVELLDYLAGEIRMAVHDAKSLNPEKVFR